MANQTVTIDEAPCGCTVEQRTVVTLLGVFPLTQSHHELAQAADAELDALVDSYNFAHPKARARFHRFVEQVMADMAK